MVEKLPADLLEDIAKRLTIEDIVRFGMVCQSWRSVPIRKQYFHSVLSRGSPWLMLTDRNTDDNDDYTRRFFNLSNKEIYNIYLPEAHGRRCWGTHYGWLVTFGLDMEIHLLNPLTRARLQLPPQSTFEHQSKNTEELYHTPENLRRYFITSALVIPSPSSDDNDRDDQFIVMALYCDGKLAIARPGDKAWTSVDVPYPDLEHVVTYFNGQFYAISPGGFVYICDITDIQHPKATLLAPPPEDVQVGEGFYLVEMGGELHLVARLYGRYSWHCCMPESSTYRSTLSFEMYKLNLCTKVWMGLRSFDDYALFVGHNSFFSVPVAQHPELKGSFIYFTDYCFSGEFYDFGCDMGAYDFKEERISPFYLGPDCLSSYSPPTFITPNLW